MYASFLKKSKKLRAICLTMMVQAMTINNFNTKFPASWLEEASLDTDLIQFCLPKF